MLVEEVLRSFYYSLTGFDVALYTTIYACVVSFVLAHLFRSQFLFCMKYIYCIVGLFIASLVCAWQTLVFGDLSLFSLPLSFKCFLSVVMVLVLIAYLQEFLIKTAVPVERRYELRSNGAILSGKNRNYDYHYNNDTKYSEPNTTNIKKTDYEVGGVFSSLSRKYINNKKTTGDAISVDEKCFSQVDNFEKEMDLLDEDFSRRKEAIKQIGSDIMSRSVEEKSYKEDESDKNSEFNVVESRTEQSYAVSETLQKMIDGQNQRFDEKILELDERVLELHKGLQGVVDRIAKLIEFMAVVERSKEPKH